MITEPLIDDPRAELIEALASANDTAKRQLTTDHLGRPNARWESCHRYINWLLDLLEG